jgi:BirA family transcriptional regulator, biotin operon repressor / biotin---[acetyl-CoA-carboxylase] ligase
MDQKTLQSRLAGLNLSEVRFYPCLGSSNDEAACWAEQGAADMSLVVAGEQTAGRGQAGRKWITPPDSGIAFSLILRLAEREQVSYALPRLTALGAMAVADALESHFGLPALIKWPNDVLVQRRKVAGVLAEAQWTGGTLAALILGIGINVAPESVREASRSETQLRFAATSVEEMLGKPVDRLDLLYAVLQKLVEWRRRLPSPEFLLAWEESLAFRGEWVQIYPGESRGKDGLPSGLEGQAPGLQEGQIIGLAPDGCLQLRTRSGETVTVRVGEVRLLPVRS